MKSRKGTEQYVIWPLFFSLNYVLVPKVVLEGCKFLARRLNTSQVDP